MTDWASMVRPSLPGLDPYRPGATVAALRELHGLDEIVKLNWNENLFGPLPGVVEAMGRETENLWMYPEQAYGDFRAAVAAYLGVSPEAIVPAHGAQALIGTVAAAFLRPGDRVVVPELTYGLYAYMDYVDPSTRVRRELDAADGRPVVALRSLSKLFGLAGLRLGYAVVHPSLAPHLDVVQEPFNVNRAALAAGCACLRDPDAIEGRRRLVAAARATLAQALFETGVRPYPSAANFVLVEVGSDDVALVEELARRGLLVRPGSELGVPGHVRITVGPEPIMRRVAAELAGVRSSSVAG
jgi:histidinol-phosphate/aromatic aminotransferase/cobyric acid decarboxylase-like protein